MDKQIHDENELLLNVILAALEGYANAPKSKKKHKKNGEESEDAGKSGQIEFNYLLGQSIRQWQIPDENWHTSKAAQAVWDLIVEKNPDPKKKFKTNLCAEKLCYKEPFICKKELELAEIPRFKGTTKDFKSIDLLPIEAGRPYVFNDIFIAEHTTPVSDIKDALEQCYNSNKKIIEKQGICAIREDVRKILNMIHITQMLKIEDRRINKSSGRLKEMYGKNNIYKTLSSKESKDVFADIRDQYYYKGLRYTKTPSPNRDDIVYQKALQIANEFDWAEAVKLDPEFKIKIL